VPCNDSDFAENSAVQEAPAGRQEIDGFSNDLNVLDGWTAAKQEIAPSSEFRVDSAPLEDGIPDIGIRRCHHCGKNGAPNQVALPDRPGVAWLHRECEAAWLEKNR
jgi:hypothetical protein